MKLRSLRRQVIVGVLSVEAFCALGLAAGALFHEWHIRTRSLDAVIRGRSDSLLGAIQDEEDPEDNVGIDPAELVLPKEDVYAVYAPDGRLLGSTPTPPPALIARRGNGIVTRTYDGRPYRVLEREGVRIIDKPENGGTGILRRVIIIYAVPSGHVWHEVLEAASFYLGASALLLLITSAVIIVLLRKLLLPIQELATAAGGISLHSLGFEAPSSAMQIAELRPLGETLAAMIAGLQRSVEQQNRFVGNAAHELKTAVSVVHSSIQLLLLRNRNSVEYSSGLEGLLTDNLRVNDLVSRMLDAARFGDEVVQRAADPHLSTDLTVIARQVIERLRPLWEAQKVRMKLQDGGQAFVRPSADELGVLVSNLIVNATQHSPAGGLVAISVEAVPGFAMLTVEDHGRGISTEALSHVFERFYREDVSRSRETGGAGLGLSICKAIVEAASGTIAIESAVGLGTTVCVKLPSSSSFRLT